MTRRFPFISKTFGFSFLSNLKFSQKLKFDIWLILTETSRNFPTLSFQSSANSASNEPELPPTTPPRSQQQPQLTTSTPAGDSKSDLERRPSWRLCVNDANKNKVPFIFLFFKKKQKQIPFVPDENDIPPPSSSFYGRKRSDSGGTFCFEKNFVIWFDEEKV